MPWGRLNDKGNSDDKLLALSDAAWRMWGCGLIYCQDKLTDGFIPEHAINTFGVRAPNKLKVAKELCAVLVAGKGPLWHKVSGGFQVHDYLDWNPSRDKVLAERQRNQDRIDRYRGRQKGNETGDGTGVRNGVQNGVQPSLDIDCNGGTNGGIHVPRTTVPTDPRTTTVPTDPSTTEKAAAAPRISRTAENPDQNIEVITALVRKELLPLGIASDALPEAAKNLCAQRGIAYNGQSVRKAVESAVFRSSLNQTIFGRSGQ